jgi:hypothetical protein
MACGTGIMARFRVLFFWRTPVKFFSVLLALSVSASAFAVDQAAPANPHAGMKMPAMAPQSDNLTQTAKVISTINVPTYTYIEASQGNKTIWLAATTVAVKKGDAIRFDDGMVMTNFYSKGLKRNFPSIVFVNKVVVASAK